MILRSRLFILGLVIVLLLMAGPLAAQETQSTSNTPQQNQPPIIIVEDFHSPQDFTQTSPNVSIIDGLAVWNVSRNAGFQYIHRPIPPFSGDVTLIVRGQIDSYTNNCTVRAGVGDNPGEGVSVNFGFFGGGCSTNGPLISGSGAILDTTEDRCQFSGNWLWVEPNQSYTVIFNNWQGIAQLAVGNVGVSFGTPTYTGPFDTLYVGLTGDGDWPSCSGNIDSIIVIGGTLDGISNASIDPTNAEALVRGMLRPSPETILQAIEANLGDYPIPFDFYLTLGLGSALGGPIFGGMLNQIIESIMPNCLPLNPQSGSRETAAACVDLWRQASDLAYNHADVVINHWWEIATIESAKDTLVDLALALVEYGIGHWHTLTTLKLGVTLHAIFGTITHIIMPILGTIHLINLSVASVEALAAVMGVWITELGYVAAQNHYSRFSDSAESPNESTSPITNVYSFMLTSDSFESLRLCSSDSVTYSQSEVNHAALEGIDLAEWAAYGLPIGAREVLWTGVTEYYLGTSQNDGAILGQVVIGFPDSATATAWLLDFIEGRTSTFLVPIDPTSLTQQTLIYSDQNHMVYQLQTGVYFSASRLSNTVIFLSIFTKDQRRCGIVPSREVLIALLNSLEQ